MNYPATLGVFACTELVGLAVFPVIKKSLGPARERAFDVKAILRGALERFVLFFALIHGYPQMLIAFGAMKLGTRLHEEQESPISNNYFLVGNLVSILFAMLSAVVVERWCS